MAKPKDTHERANLANKKQGAAAKGKSSSTAPNDAQIDSPEEISAPLGEEPAGTADNCQTAHAELAALNDKYLRLAAEYDNFRKRTAKERDAIYGNAKADAIGRLLPIYDNLERALKLECSDEAYYKGIELTMLQFTELLKDLGIVAIDTVGETFDPKLHDAVLRIEDPELGEGVIAEECKKGFLLGERVIRFAEVVVAN